jgi:hypothetical protein
MKLFYFNGNLGPAYENGRPEDTCVFSLKENILLQLNVTYLKQLYAFGSVSLQQLQKPIVPNKLG